MPSRELFQKAPTEEFMPRLEMPPDPEVFWIMVLLTTNLYGLESVDVEVSVTRASMMEFY